MYCTSVFIIGTNLNVKGLKVAYLSSQSDDKGQQETVLRGEAQIVFFGPELLLKNATWREMLRTPIYRTDLVAFVIDEVHCATIRCPCVHNCTGV